jgi:hypothetical protein
MTFPAPFPLAEKGQEKPRNPACGGVSGMGRGALLAQAFFHERFALGAFFAGGFLVAGFHFFLLRGFRNVLCFVRGGGFMRRGGGFLGAQAFLHESLAFVAFFAIGFGLLAAGAHFLLLRGELLAFGGMGQTGAASQTQRGDQGEKFLHGLGFLAVGKKSQPDESGALL